MPIVGEDEGWNNRIIEKVEVGMESAAVRSHGVGQRTVDKEGAAEAYLAGQVEILAKMLKSRSVSGVKPTLCVCDSLPYHTHFLCPCTIFHFGNHTELNFF